MSSPGSSGPALNRAGRTGIAREYARVVLQAALLFGCAGRLIWPAAWLYLGLVLASQTALTTLLLRRHPELLNLRGAPPAGSKRWDLTLVIGAFLLGYMALVVAGLDAGAAGPPRGPPRSRHSGRPPSCFPPS